MLPKHCYLCLSLVLYTVNGYVLHHRSATKVHTVFGVSRGTPLLSASNAEPSTSEQERQKRRGSVLRPSLSPQRNPRRGVALAGTRNGDLESVDGKQGSAYSDDLKRTLAWVTAAVAFSIGIAATMGTTAAIEFCSGYVLEQCLSVDNLFVFLLLFDYFSVRDKALQEKVLGYGIWGALVLRGLFIGIGAVALEQFHQVLFLFAIILAYSSYQILFPGAEEEDGEDVESNAVVRFAKNFIKTTDNFDGDKFFTTNADGVKLATPLLLCLVCVELSDVVFAFDSVPAVFGVTQNPFIVYTSNIFAISGLRSLYGVLSQAVADLKYLEQAVGLVLAVIALKLGAGTFDVELLNPLQSLAVVVSILGTGVFLSINERNRERVE